MTADDQRFMAFCGLLQWSDACFIQATRTMAASDAHRRALSDPAASQRLGLRLHSECHFFVGAAWKLLEHREWIREFDVGAKVDFSDIDRYDRDLIRDLRDKREHVVDYFQGRGRVMKTWLYSTALYSADASSLTGVMIGGRLDYMAFGAAASRLHSHLQTLQIPYPSSAVIGRE